MPEGATATDLVLTVTQMLRKHGVVGKFVEFFGDGLDHLPLADRATIANMAPEYGATCGIFPVDEESLNYLRLSGRSEDQIALVEAYAKAQGLWRDATRPRPIFSATLELDMGDGAALAGRPQASAGPRAAADMKANFEANLGRYGQPQAAMARCATFKTEGGAQPQAHRATRRPATAQDCRTRATARW